LLVGNTSSDLLKTPKSPSRRREWEQKTLRLGSTSSKQKPKGMREQQQLRLGDDANGQLETIAVKGSSERFGL